MKFSPATTNHSEDNKKETFVRIDVYDYSEDTEPLVQEEQLQQPLEREFPDRYGEWVCLSYESENPKSVKEALSNLEKDECIKAMERDVESLNKNEIWDLVEPPEGRKPVGCKWVFKKKHYADGNTEQFKARLVAQGYNRTFGIDCDETFSPAVRFESMRTIIAFRAEHNLKLHQIDTTTAFLNVELKETTYMKQPEGILANRKENLVRELKRSLYDIKQSHRSWNEAGDKYLN